MTFHYIGAGLSLIALAAWKLVAKPWTTIPCRIIGTSKGAELYCFDISKSPRRQVRNLVRKLDAKEWSPAHSFLHSLGYSDEDAARIYDNWITVEKLTENEIASKPGQLRILRYDLTSLLARGHKANPPEGQMVVQNFGLESLNPSLRWYRSTCVLSHRPIGKVTGRVFEGNDIVQEFTIFHQHHTEITAGTSNSTKINSMEVCCFYGDIPPQIHPTLLMVWTQCPGAYNIELTYLGRELT